MLRWSELSSDDVRSAPPTNDEIRLGFLTEPGALAAEDNLTSHLAMVGHLRSGFCQAPLSKGLAGTRVLVALSAAPSRVSSSW